ncbi:MAG: hypothetical protein N2B05_13280, partial [Gemmatimonadales bacterium]
MIRKSSLVSLLVSMVAVVGACTEDPFLAVDSESAPGVATPTLEIYLEAGELPSWRDTTYWGFVVPNSASFSLLSDREELRARPLGRFSTIPDSVFVDTLRLAIDSFTAAEILLSVDSALSELPSDSVELAAWTLSR